MAKICICVTSEWYDDRLSGWQQFILPLCQASHDITLVMTLSSQPVSEVFLTYLNLFCKEHGLGIVRLADVRGDLHLSYKDLSYRVYHWLKEQAFDVVLFDDATAIGYYSIEAKHQGIGLLSSELVVCLQGSKNWSFGDDATMLDHFDTLVMLTHEPLAIAHADQVITFSPSLLSWYRQQGWELPDRQHVFSFTRTSHRKRVTTLSYRHLAFVGGALIAEGCALFIAAIKAMLREGVLLEKISFYIISTLQQTTMTHSSIEEALSGITIPYTITTYEDPEQLLDAVVSSDALVVVPSLRSSQPLMALNCLDAGIPCVVAYNPIHKDFFSEDFYQTISFPFHVKGLCATLRRLQSEGYPDIPTRTDQDSITPVLAWLNATLSHPSKRQGTLLPQDRVSICLTHFNRAHFLAEALDSIRAQTYPYIEVVLVDDGSTNPEVHAYLDSLEDEFRQKQWRIIRKENGYLGAARNTAVAYSTGSYIKFMDDDNRALPHEIETMIRVARHLDADIVTCCLIPFEGEGPSLQDERKLPWIPSGHYPILGMVSNSFGDANALIRRTCFDALGGFSEDYGIGHEDWEFFAKANLKGYKSVMIPEALFYYRVARDSMLRTTNLFRNHERNLRPYKEQYPELYYMLHYLQSVHAEIGTRRYEAYAGEQAKIKLTMIEEELEAVYRSRSWKMTRPLRQLATRLSQVKDLLKPKKPFQDVG